MTQPPRSDEGTQQRILSDFQTTFLLEAGAGTGKTQLLLNRLLALLRTGQPLSRIAVITFTEKAAAELRGRLRAATESVLQTALSEPERAALQAGLQQLDRAMVMTIHAFCAALLRERALEVGLDPAFTILNQDQASGLHETVWHDWIAQESNHGSEVIRRAFRAGLSIVHLKSLCDFLIDQRDCLAWLPRPVAAHIPTYCANMQEAVARLAALRDCCQDPTDKVFEQITYLLDRVPSVSYQENTAAWMDCLLSQLNIQPRKGKQANWQPPTALHDARTVLTQIKESHRKARAAWLHDLIVELVRWLDGYLQAYQAIKRRRGEVDFLDLLVMMRDGLKQNRELRRYFQRKFDFLLVDEVQDTDPLQAEILFFLAEDRPRTDDWSQVALQAGKLFLVGDPQQSIYRFRRADLEIYHVVRSAVERQGAVLTLSTNFRMRTALVMWMNDTFSRVLTHGDDPDQPDYLPLEATRNESIEKQNAAKELAQAPTAFFLHLPDAKQNELDNRDALRNTEAHYTVRFIRQIIEQKKLVTQAGQTLTYGDIAVLCRTNRSVETYEKALREAGIPHRSSGTQQSATHQDQAELLACVRALTHPADTTALVATLRSSLFGFSDEELLQFVCAGGELNYLKGRVPASLSCAGQFHAAFALLRTCHTKALRSTHNGLPSILADLYSQTPLIPLLALRPHGQQRIGRLRQIVEMLRGIPSHSANLSDFSMAGAGGLEGSMKFLERLLASAPSPSSSESTFEDEQSDTLEGANGALHLLTIHKAKGLEFSLVVIAEAGAQPSRLARTGLVQRKDQRLELHIGPRSLRCSTLGWPEAEEQERNKEAAEERRLWYVAATRAREYVVIPMHVLHEKKKKGAVNELRTVLSDISSQVENSTLVSHTETTNGAVSDDRLAAHEKEQDSEISPVSTGQDSLVFSLSQALEQGASSGSTIAGEPYSDVNWITARRRLIAQGRRKGEAQKRRVIRSQPYSQKPKQLSRIARQIALGLRREKKGGISLSSLLQEIGEAEAQSIQMSAPGGPPLSDLLQRLERAAIWPRVQDAKKCIVDEPFRLCFDKMILEGTIPIAFLEGGKWVVIDFFLRSEYRPEKEQTCVCEVLGPSALALDHLTHTPVKELLLFFTDQQREVRAIWDSEQKNSFQNKWLG